MKLWEKMKLLEEGKKLKDKKTGEIYFLSKEYVLYVDDCEERIDLEDTNNIDFEIVREPISFQEALTVMVKGKICEHFFLNDILKYKIHDGFFLFYSDEIQKWCENNITNIAKFFYGEWYVVEEMDNEK